MHSAYMFPAARVSGRTISLFEKGGRGVPDKRSSACYIKTKALGSQEERDKPALLLEDRHRN